MNPADLQNVILNSWHQLNTLIVGAAFVALTGIVTVLVCREAIHAMTLRFR